MPTGEPNLQMPEANKVVYFENKVSDFLFLYGMAFNGVVGTTGNILALMVLTRKRMRQGTVGLYLIVISATDLIITVSGIWGRHLIRSATGFDPTSIHNWYCKGWYYVINVALSYNHWVLAGVSVERSIAIIFPLRSLTLITKRNAQIYMVISLICLLLYNSHSFHKSYIVVERQGKAVCTVDESNVFAKEIKAWSDFFIINVIPAIFICLCNGFLIYKLFCIRAKNPVLQNTSKGLHDGIQSVLPMLVVVSVMYLVLLTPNHIIYIKHTAFKVQYSSGQTQATENMLWAIVAFLVYFNHAINFLLYIVSGSEFRTEFKAMVISMCCSCCTVKTMLPAHEKTIDTML